MGLSTALALVAGLATLRAQPPAQNAPALPPQAQQRPDVATVWRGYRPVTAERLKNPEPDNWLTLRRTYDGWDYSPLAQITAANVADLRPGALPQPPSRHRPPHRYGDRPSSQHTSVHQTIGSVDKAVC
jgi:hypothetical protein